MANKSTDIDQVWFPHKINAGVISAKKGFNTVFAYDGKKVIQKISTSCPCLTAKLIDDNGFTVITATWNPRKPEHEFYASTKTIIVRYTDGSRDTLEIKGSIID